MLAREKERETRIKHDFNSYEGWEGKRMPGETAISIANSVTSPLTNLKEPNDSQSISNEHALLKKTDSDIILSLRTQICI